MYSHKGGRERQILAVGRRIEGSLVVGMKDGWVAGILGPDLDSAKLGADKDGKVTVISSSLACLGDIERTHVVQSWDKKGGEGLSAVGGVFASDGIFIPV